jgi:ParB-like chromosome segregation protein Spo0J
MLGSIGKIDAILAYESEKHGGLIIIDGHQRQELADTYPVIVLDVSDEEATKILMTYNPIADLATQDHEAYRELLATIEAEDLRQSKELAIIAQSVLGEQVTSDKAEDVVLKRIDVKAPPERIWVVVGVPVNEFGVINSIVEQLQVVPNVIVEMTPSDWMPKKDDE